MLTLTTRQQSPGIRFPPTLWYVGGFLGGWRLQQVWPLALYGAGNQSFARGLGWLLGALGLLMIALAVAGFLRHRTAMYPNQPASTIVRSGVYRFTRNPMYLGLVLAYLALTLLKNLFWPLLPLPLVLLIIQKAVIAREEAYLHAAFGETYAQYCRQVRRWL